MKLAALISGGKDSIYAAYKASKQHEIACLISFKSKKTDSYMFHIPNIELVKLQAKAMNLPLIFLESSGIKEKELEDIIKAFELTKKFKIKTIAYMILGYKGETLGAILQSVRLYNKINPDVIVTCPATLYPGTDLYNDAKNHGLISDDYWLSNKNAPIYTGSFSLFNILLITFLVTSYFELKKGFISYFRYLLRYINKGLIKKEYFRENFFDLKE